jgi:hypothetical protein
MTMRIFNASPGFGAPLTEEEVKYFLTNSKLNVHLGTVDEKGDSVILEITPRYYSTWDYSKRRRGGGEGEG